MREVEGALAKLAGSTPALPVLLDEGRDLPPLAHASTISQEEASSVACIAHTVN